MPVDVGDWVEKLEIDVHELLGWKSKSLQTAVSQPLPSRCPLPLVFFSTSFTGPSADINHRPETPGLGYAEIKASYRALHLIYAGDHVPSVVIEVVSLPERPARRTRIRRKPRQLPRCTGTAAAFLEKPRKQCNGTNNRAGSTAYLNSLCSSCTLRLSQHSHASPSTLHTPLRLS